jgi:hypothetical protein
MSIHRRDGPLASLLGVEERHKIEELIRQAKLLLHVERGCLAVICDDDDISFIKNLVASQSPPILHLHHGSMFAFMAPASDTRFSPYHQVSCKRSSFGMSTPTESIF